MVTPRTGRPRGRPRKSLLADPERFAVPFVDALLVLGVSETDAFKIAMLQLIGRPVAVRTVGPRRKRGRGAVPGGTLVSYEGRCAHRRPRHHTAPEIQKADDCRNSPMANSHGPRHSVGAHRQGPRALRRRNTPIGGIGGRRAICRCLPIAITGGQASFSLARLFDRRSA
jgi:hypothetical protein